MDKEARFLRAAYKGGHVWYQNKFMWLFIFMLCVLIYYPYSLGSNFRYYSYRAMFCLVILFTVYALSMRRSLLVVALVLAVPSVVQHTVYVADPKSPIGVVNSLLALAFDIFIVVVIFRRIFSKTHADSESIFGALCIYLFVGFSFASIFLLLTHFEPHAFYLDPVVSDHQVLNRLDAVYYSFGTMTSLGAAGITPVSGEARLFTIIETLLGVLFLAVLISRLLSAYSTKSSAVKVEEQAGEITS
ncbi:ion channel [Acidobacterium sp. S8]|uniref:ion channel n=1 Tax=Acidobacterium sp. S8 TaxID=1641854 RepID=UPI00131E4B03|nr:ion channel [Acidobacterium sp. S8]